MPTVVIETGENPPEVTVTVAKLIDLCTKADGDRQGDSFKTFMVMAGHFVNPDSCPFPETFTEVGLTGPSEELAGFFEGGTLSENARAALELLSSDENVHGSELGVLLEVTRKQFA